MGKILKQEVTTIDVDLNPDLGSNILCRLYVLNFSRIFFYIIRIHNRNPEYQVLTVKFSSKRRSWTVRLVETVQSTYTFSVLIRNGPIGHTSEIFEFLKKWLKMLFSLSSYQFLWQIWVPLVPTKQRFSMQWEQRCNF